jgi:hypothetical protein
MPKFEIITRGNDKLGPHPYHVDLPSVTTCPGASDYCATKVCYTKRFVRYPNVARKYGDNWELWQTDPAEYEARIMRDLEKLPANKIHDFRWHVSGDIPDVAYARMIGRIAEYFPRINFWVYTRSYRVNDNLALAIAGLADNYANLRVWYSTDPELPPVPDRCEARIFETEEDARQAGYAVCPEQVGRKESCEDCRLCIDITKDKFRLAFIRH